MAGNTRSPSRSSPKHPHHVTSPTKLIEPSTPRTSRRSRSSPVKSPPVSSSGPDAVIDLSQDAAHPRAGSSAATADEPDDDPAKYTCVVCMDLLYKPVCVPCCGNFFCHDCLEAALRISVNCCPLCRKRLLSFMRKKQDVIDEQLWATIQNKFPHKCAKRAEAAERERAAASNGGLGSGQDDDDDGYDDLTDSDAEAKAEEARLAARVKIVPLAPGELASTLAAEERKFLEAQAAEEAATMEFLAREGTLSAQSKRAEMERADYELARRLADQERSVVAKTAETTATTSTGRVASGRDERALARAALSPRALGTSGKATTTTPRRDAHAAPRGALMSARPAKTTAPHSRSPPKPAKIARVQSRTSPLWHTTRGPLLRSEGAWQCSRCTYMNCSDWLRCDMCSQTRQF